MTNQQQMMKRQQVLGDFGEFALRSDEIDAVLTEACRLVCEALGTTRAKVLEIQHEENELLVRAGVGWGPHVVGELRLPMSERSSEAFSIREAKPVISQDIRKEDRFDIPQFMKDAGVVAMVNVPIFMPGRKPYGLLQVDADEPRNFGREDIEFLRTYATILGPVIDRLQKIRSLKVSEERFRYIVETARDYAIFTTDAEDRINGWFPGAEAVFGWTAAEAVGQPGSIVFTPEDRNAGEDKKEVEAVRREGLAPNTRWHVRKDGERVFIEGVVRALYGEAGGVHGFLKVGQDVTKRRNADERLRESEQQLQVMVAELQHRTRNLIGVVGSIVRQTMAQTGPTEAFQQELMSRLEALSRVQSLLSQAGEERITIREVVELELKALGAASFDDRVRVDGPDVPLRKSVVQTLALAIHELATNARKYGALGDSHGELGIRWTTHREKGEERRLFFEWIERGVAVRLENGAAVVQGGGYGRELIEKALPYSLKAQTTYTLGPDGLTCTIDLPLGKTRPKDPPS